VNGLNEVVIFQMDVDFLNDALYETISFDLFLYSFDNIVDFLMVLAGRVVLSVD